MTEQAAMVFEPTDAWGLEALLISRVRLYTLFQKVFGGNTTRELVEALTSEDTRNAVEEFAEGSVEMQALLQLLDELGKLDPQQLADDAKYEYTRLFIGPGATPAPVTESPYVTRDEAVLQENTLVVRMDYRMYGLQAKRFQRVPEDHVAMMCGFMAIRAQQALDAVREGRLRDAAPELRAQQAFVTNHMANWLPEFASVIRRKSKTTVMIPQLIEALSVFVKLDATLLSESAYWAETVQLPEAGVPEPPAEVAAAFAQATSAIEQLQAIRLVGLEDVELVALKA